MQALKTDAAIVCPLLPEHEEAWARLWRRYQEFYEVDIPAATTRTVWRRLFEPGEPVAGFIAFVEGDAAGIAHALTHRSFWSSQDSCYLQDLFASHAYRRRGVARSLVDAVCVYARQKQCARVHWLTKETNDTAIALYEQITVRTGSFNTKCHCKEANDATPRVSRLQPPTQRSNDAKDN